MKTSARAPGPSFRFRYGSPALDLAVTLRRRTSKQIELLNAPADAEAWLEQAGLADARLHIGEKELKRLRETREAIYRVGRAAVSGQTPPAADVRTLNLAARHADSVPQLASDWSIQATRRGFDAALAQIAREAITLFADADRRARLRTCEQADCRGLFLDRSRGERRKWCSMARCGSRAKVAAFRQRQKEHQS